MRRRRKVSPFHAREEEDEFRKLGEARIFHLIFLLPQSWLRLNFQVVVEGV